MEDADPFPSPKGAEFDTFPPMLEMPDKTVFMSFGQAETQKNLAYSGLGKCTAILTQAVGLG